MITLTVGCAATAQERRYEVVVKPMSSESGFEKVKVSKAALGSTQIMLWRNAAINPDCTAVDGVTLSILRPPEHGKATVSDEPLYAAYPPANPRSACNNRKVPGHQAFYQADAGFTGHDTLVLQGSSPEGRVRQITVDILVR
ncbi:MAG: hypothetical protein E8A12_10260 [Phenylobacterium sp.]|nr:hypothetical protein [Phenylobacterium sp.]THD61131.1 MAG: hypothetical protein E8A12_10260 [Phenylobacterium sp.]